MEVMSSLHHAGFQAPYGITTRHQLMAELGITARPLQQQYGRRDRPEQRPGLSLAHAQGCAARRDRCANTSALPARSGLAPQ